MDYGEDIIETVTTYFNFLITEFDFKLLEKKIIGNTFYDIKYNDKKKIVSISYENIEDYLLVIIFILENGELPDYDDKTKTLHLNHLNGIILANISKIEINLNNEFFSKFNTENEIERKLLKSAKELRLCLKNLNKLLILP